MEKTMSSEMYEWIEKSIEEYYHLVRVLKKDDKKEIALYQHKESGKTVVAKWLQNKSKVYERLATIEHPNVVKVLEAISNDECTIAIEEYLDGVSVADLLENQSISSKMVYQIILQVCDGLEILHENEIVHRDIKPENVFVLQDGSVKIIDFDASRIYRKYEKKDTVVLGTIGYAPPEQYGEAQTDARSDIYALGVLMNVMFTGKHPVNEIANGKIGNIIEKCIMVNQNKRYRNVSEIKEQLKKLTY